MLLLLYFLDIEKRLKIYEASKIYNSINRAKIINFIPCKNPFPSFNCSSTCISHFFFLSVMFLLPCTFTSIVSLFFFALSLFFFLIPDNPTDESLYYLQISPFFVVSSFLIVIIVNLFAFLSFFSSPCFTIDGARKSHSRISLMRIMKK